MEFNMDLIMIRCIRLNLVAIIEEWQSWKSPNGKFNIFEWIIWSPFSIFFLPFFIIIIIIDSLLHGKIFYFLLVPAVEDIGFLRLDFFFIVLSKYRFEMN